MEDINNIDNDDSNDNNDEKNYNGIKVTLLGNSGVGKTCIILRYTKNEYNDNTISSRGVSYSSKIITINNKDVQLDLWDTAGQEKFRSLGMYFYKDSHIVLLVYDITNRESFEDLKNVWYNDLKKYGEQYTVLAVVGNKCDMYEEENTVPEEEARKFAEEKNAEFMLVSAKTGDNINVLFNILTNKYFDPNFQTKIEEKNDQLEGSVKIKKRNEKEEKLINARKKGCC